MPGSLEEAFAVLGVEAGTSPDGVARAFRRLARTNHPDVSSAPDATQRFAAICAAYRRLAADAAARPHLPTPPHDTDRSPAATPSTGAAAPYRRPSNPMRSWPIRAEATVLDLGSGYMPAPLHDPPIIAGPVRVRQPRPDEGGR